MEYKIVSTKDKVIAGYRYERGSALFVPGHGYLMFNRAVYTPRGGRKALKALTEGINAPFLETVASGNGGNFYFAY